MFEWIIKISTTAVLFTIVSYLLPKGNIRNASLTALSFLFLAIIMLPLKNVATELINKKYVLQTEKNELLSQIKNDGIENQVIEHYKERLKEEIEGSLKNKKYKCHQIFISVDEDVKSESFGKVLNVICDLSIEKEENKNSIGKIEVPNIVIDQGGIRFEKDNNAIKPDMTKYEKEVKEMINELTDVDKNRITIRWGE